MKENNNISKIILIIIILGVGLGVGFFLGNRNTKPENTIVDKEEPTKPNNDTPTKEEEIKEESKEKIEFTGKETKETQNKELHDKLREYGEKIYSEYTSLPKKDDVYFASLNTLKDKYNYDISLFTTNGYNCDKNNTGVYIDVDHKLAPNDENNEKGIITILIKCNNEKNE